MNLPTRNNLKAPIGGSLYYYMLHVCARTGAPGVGHLCLDPVITYYLKYFMICSSYEFEVDCSWFVEIIIFSENGCNIYSQTLF